jgi:glycosyltransferase involved in cell wall biosynthesis
VIGDFTASTRDGWTLARQTLRQRGGMSGCESLQFHVISFEGPDAYARAGGIASRVTGLTEALAAAGFDTHLWFVGDPSLPGTETRARLSLHRWCQWISRHHPHGVYDGEEVKRSDLVASLPPALMRDHLLVHLGAGGRAVVLAEEWQTVDAVLHLDWLLRCAGLRHRAALLWNANNTFGFDRIDWKRLAAAAAITTVSRYMRQQMWSLGVDPLVIPNGLAEEALRPPDMEAVKEIRRRTPDRFRLAKVARWDPDKRWVLAVETVAELKRSGWRPLLIARGGLEAHGVEVLARARMLGLRVQECSTRDAGAGGLLECLSAQQHADVLSLRSPLSADACRALYRGADAVLANSGHEPFGLVGLETMAAGGLACTGSTGEDYVVPGWNALVLQSSDPREFVRHFHRLRSDPQEARAMRRRGPMTARRFVWREVVLRNLLPHLHVLNRPEAAGRSTARPGLAAR